MHSTDWSMLPFTALSPAQLSLSHTDTRDSFHIPFLPCGFLFKLLHFFFFLLETPSSSLLPSPQCLPIKFILFIEGIAQTSHTPKCLARFFWQERISPSALYHSCLWVYLPCVVSIPGCKGHVSFSFEPRLMSFAHSVQLTDSERSHLLVGLTCHP